MFVELVLTVITFLGLGMLYWAEIRGMLDKAKRCCKLYVYGFRQDVFPPAIRRENVDKGVIDTLSRLLQATLGFGARRSAYVFLVVSFILCLLIFFILKGRISAAYVLTASAFALVLPLLLILARLQTLRISSSREGEILLSELCDNYKINYFNMQQAIEVTALTIKEAPNCKRLLFNLSKGLNTLSEEGEIRELLKDFRFAIGTSWSGILADNMYFALVSGIRVTAAMEDLVVTVSKARKVEEFAKRENNEAGLILKYLAPLCYLLTFLGGIKYFGLTGAEFLEYQFMTSAGLSWFIISMMVYLAGIMLRMFLSRSKLDL